VCFYPEVSWFSIVIELVEQTVLGFKLKTGSVPPEYQYGISISIIPPYFGNSVPGVIDTVKKPSWLATTLAVVPVLVVMVLDGVGNVAKAGKV